VTARQSAAHGATAMRLADSVVVHKEDGAALLSVAS
jgi:hypothetical protein